MTRGLAPTHHTSWPRADKAKLPRTVRATAQRLRAFLHFRPSQRVKGRTTMQAACNRTQGGAPFRLRRVQHGGPGPHVTGAPVTTCKKLHRHSRQYRAFSTAEPVPRLEATLRITRQCQPSTSVTGQSVAGEGATVDTTRNGPAVMAVARGRKRQSSHQQAHVPSWDSERTFSHGVKATRPRSVPRTARARTTDAPQTTRPVALTLRQDGWHLWQAK
jgi:hypothetical protein